MVTISFACGHTATQDNTVQVAICPQCAERRVTRVKARAPRFRGVCVGPHAKYESLTGIPVTVGVPDAE